MPTTHHFIVNGQVFTWTSEVRPQATATRSDPLQIVLTRACLYGRSACADFALKSAALINLSCNCRGLRALAWAARWVSGRGGCCRTNTGPGSELEASHACPAAQRRLTAGGVACSTGRNGWCNGADVPPRGFDVTRCGAPRQLARCCVLANRNSRVSKP